MENDHVAVAQLGQAHGGRGCQWPPAVEAAHHHALHCAAMDGHWRQAGQRFAGRMFILKLVATAGVHGRTVLGDVLQGDEGLAGEAVNRIGTVVEGQQGGGHRRGRPHDNHGQ